MNRKTKILLADDHPIFRKGLIDIISEAEDLDVIAEASDGKTALNLILEKKPDIVILDINMPELTGLEVARIIKKQKLNTKIIFLTMYKEEEVLNKILDFDSAGYVLKECAADDLLESINYVKEGKSYINPKISDILIRKNKEKTELISKINNLSATEKKILSLIAEEKTSREISEHLFISIRTVENHRINICHKLELHGINSLLKFAIENKHLL